MAGWVVKEWTPAILKDQFLPWPAKAGVSAVVYVQLTSLVGVAEGGRHYLASAEFDSLGSPRC
jgi:hypothetical protein